MQGARPIDVNLVVTRNSPCSQEGNDWRECLKEDDFMPDRDLKKCEKFRKCFYDCVKAWRAKQEPLKPGQPGAASKVPGSTPELCSGLTDKLRVCMEINMFETAKCQREMGALRECMARVDPEVAAVNKELQEDLAKHEAMQEDMLRVPQLTQMEQQVWTKLWGEKPKHGQEK